MDESLQKNNIEKELNLSNINAFDALGYIYIPKEKRKKLGWKSERCIMMGYGNGGYRVWNPTTL